MVAETAVTLDDALQRVRETQVEPVEAALSEAAYAGARSITVSGDRYDLTPPAWSAFCEYVALPPDLLPTFGRGFAAIVLKCLMNTGRRGKGAPERIRLVQNRKGETISVAPVGLACLTNAEVVELIREAWPAQISSDPFSTVVFWRVAFPTSRGRFSGV